MSTAPAFSPGPWSTRGPAGREPGEQGLAGLVAAVLAPHGTDDAQLDLGRRSAQAPRGQLVLVAGQRHLGELGGGDRVVGGMGRSPPARPRQPDPRRGARRRSGGAQARVATARARGASAGHGARRRSPQRRCARGRIRLTGRSRRRPVSRHRAPRRCGRCACHPRCPSSGSAARSGWGIIPSTLRPSFTMPAMSRIDPFGEASPTGDPSGRDVAEGDPARPPPAGPGWTARRRSGPRRG